jgi:hypothetical protein
MATLSKMTVSTLPLLVCTILFLQGAAQAQAPAADAVAPSVSQAGTAVSSRVPRDSCFPLEKLPTPLRAEAEKLLLSLLDSEALYTVIGGMKPMSSGFASYRVNTKLPKTGTLDEARRIMATFRCGDRYYADVLPFHQAQKDTRFFEAVMFYRPAVQAMVTKNPEFFSPYGITPTMEPIAIAISLENDPTPARNRGLGYLYGYPKRAVDFFVTSTIQQEKTKKLVPRDFFQIPTFKRETGSFVYAVPKNSGPAKEDLALKEKARRILAAYKERREKYIGDGKPGVAALVRDWLDDGTGYCAPENAKY